MIDYFQDWNNFKHQFALKLLHEVIYPTLAKEKFLVKKKNAYVQMIPSWYGKDNRFYFRLGPLYLTNIYISNYKDFQDLEYDKDTQEFVKLDLPELTNFNSGEYDTDYYDELSSIFSVWRNSEFGTIFGVEEHSNKNINVNYNNLREN